MLNFIKSIPSKFRNNIGLKLLSLLLAFILWLLVVAYYNPETTNLIKDIPITINYDDAILEQQGLILVTVPDEMVDVQIEGRREILALISKDKVSARIDISSVTKAGEYDLPVVIGIDGQTVTTLSQSVNTLTLKFEKAVKSQFTVDAITNGKVEKGYFLEKVANPTVVTVTGPESVVSKIATIQALVSQEKFAESGVYDATIHYLDATGNILDDAFLSLDAESVKVNVNIFVEKVVPLTLELINSSGGNDGSYLIPKITPETITIAGSEDALAQINSISLGTLDVAEITKNYSEKKVPILPNGIKNQDALENASVDISFENIISKKFELSSDKVKVENVAKGNKIQLPDGKISVMVRGNAADVEKMTAGDITLYIDCKNQSLSKGTQRMTVYCGFSEDYKVGAVGKYELTIKVS